jgi:murein DD-endopeptidase MepM/ murein hydrolase activator NlpD
MSAYRNTAVTAAILLLLVVPVYLGGRGAPAPGPAGDTGDSGKDPTREIEGTFRKGETFARVFERYRLDVEELFRMRQAAAGIHRLGAVSAGRPYRIAVGPDNVVLSLAYCINDEEILQIIRSDPGYRVGKVAIPHERRIGTLGGVILSNLVSAMPAGGDAVPLAMDLSDIFSWDVDFNTDFRKGDTFRVVVEELWLDGAFRKYGHILAAELAVDGKVCRAYRFEAGGRADYYDEEGKSLQRAFLKAPLSYRRISSGFTARRVHPILRITRPHYGVDYAAPAGTPVSAVGDGTVTYAGYKGPNGNLVVVKHPNGFVTSYGHLSRIRKGVRKGAALRQGEVLGYVGSTGLATGPHLDFRMRRNGVFLNPQSVDLPRGDAVPPGRMDDFRGVRDDFARSLAAVSPGRLACVPARGGAGR